MYHNESDQQKSNLAWYKLADLIAKKEKEKAISLYRLLAHSYHDKAFVLQVEGDILWSLEDESAAEKYKQAALLYKKDKQWVNAISLCKHILSFDARQHEVYRILFELYLELDRKEQALALFDEICRFVEQKKLLPEKCAQMLKMVLKLSKGFEGHQVRTWFFDILQQGMNRMPESLKHYIEIK